MRAAESARSATALGGQVMRRPDELGQIKLRFLAGMILVDGDPLTDITVLQDSDRIVAIMKAGVFHKDPGDGAEAHPR